MPKKTNKPTAQSPIPADDAKPMTWTKHQPASDLTLWTTTHTTTDHLLLYAVTHKPGGKHILTARYIPIPESSGSIRCATKTFPSFQQARSFAHLAADQAPWRIKSLKSPASLNPSQKSTP